MTKRKTEYGWSIDMSGRDTFGLNATYNGKGLTFSQWEADVNESLAIRAGLGMDDFASACQWDAWSDGIDPDDWAEQLLYDGGLY